MSTPSHSDPFPEFHPKRHVIGPDPINDDAQVLITAAEFNAFRLLEGGARALRAHGESCACRDPDQCSCGMVTLFDALDRLDKARAP